VTEIPIGLSSETMIWVVEALQLRLVLRADGSRAGEARRGHASMWLQLAVEDADPCSPMALPHRAMSSR